jgi:LytS/YehU family sensor histidine kinase
VRIEISNPGAFAGPRDGGNGLAIVKKRLSLTFGNGASFTIGAEGADRTHAVVVVPKQSVG